MASNGPGGSSGAGGKMKLKLNTAQAASSAAKPSADPTPTPSTGIKLKFSQSSQAPSGSPAQPQQTPITQTPKGGRKPSTAASNKSVTTPASATKTTPASKKQPKKEPPTSATKPNIKAIRLNSISAGSGSKAAQRKPSLIRLASGKPIASPSTSSNPRLRLKNKGKLPPRPLGVGYDSECEDAEDDPAIEENFILRMPPGPDCDYVHKAIEERKLGLPLAEGGADISMHVFSARRAAIKVRGRTYAAVLVDLPCIVESMKSWDRKGWWKSADVAQMMLVTKQIDNEDEARNAPLPPEIDDKTWQWPHGLTPPMHNARKRRFRKRVSQKTIEQAEEEVERLLAEDEDVQRHGGTVRSELLDIEQLRREEEGEDGEGDMDVDGDSQALDDAEEDDLEWAAQFEARLGEEDNAVDAAGTPVPAAEAEPLLADSDSQAPTPAAVDADAVDAEGDVEMADSPAVIDVSDAAAQDSRVQTPVPVESSSDEDDDEDEDEDEDEEDDEEDEDVDDETRERMQHQSQQREEIAHLERQIAERRDQLAKQTNPLLKAKLAATIKRFEEERDVKKRGVGITDDDDDEDDD